MSKPRIFNKNGQWFFSYYNYKQELWVDLKAPSFSAAVDMQDGYYLVGRIKFNPSK